MLPLGDRSVKPLAMPEHRKKIWLIISPEFPWLKELRIQQVFKYMLVKNANANTLSKSVFFPKRIQK